MGLFEWIFNNLYIVAVIGFALFSFLGKAAKSADPNKKRPGNGMPTFGGSGDSRVRPRRPLSSNLRGLRRQVRLVTMKPMTISMMNLMKTSMMKLLTISPM